MGDTTDTGHRSSEGSQRRPCHHHRVTETTSVDANGAGPAESTRPRLLLVEDDRALGPLLVEVLTEQHEVDLARDGQAGLHLALTRAYDVMVIDRGLPAIDGISLIGRLRGRGISTPILILTARGTVADRVEGLDAGAEDYVVKPFEIDELLARLRALLRRHSETSAMVNVGRRRLDVVGRRVDNDRRGGALGGPLPQGRRGAAVA